MNQMVFEARRWCNGDDEWSRWIPCSNDQAQEWAKDPSFEVRALTRATVMEQKVTAAPVMSSPPQKEYTRDYWIGECRRYSMELDTTRRLLAESQAREKMLREFVAAQASRDVVFRVDSLAQALAPPVDDTALNTFVESHYHQNQEVVNLLTDLTMLVSGAADHSPNSLRVEMIKLANRAHKLLKERS